MECRHAYLDKNIEYVLCDKEPKPIRQDRTSLFHAVCGHQVHCPKQSCHKLSASWVNCTKLSEKPLEATREDFIKGMPVDDGNKKKPTRGRRKPAEQE